MTLEEKLIEYIKDKSANDLPNSDCEVLEAVESLERGNFYLVFNIAEVEKFGGKENLQNIAANILNNI